MSRLLVTQYQAEVEKIIRYGGSKKETSIRNAFERLLNDYCKPRNYLLIPELDFKTKLNTIVFPDGTVKDAIRLEHGWWKSKDQYDKLDDEIEKKLEKGYPDENILFEDSQTAVLIQHSRELLRVSMRDAEALDGLISTFVDYERPEVRDFWSAIIKFKEDVPHILEALRSIIAQQEVPASFAGHQTDLGQTALLHSSPIDHLSILEPLMDFVSALIASSTIFILSILNQMRETIPKFLAPKTMFLASKQVLH